ncbi:MAG: potassium transporter Kup [Acidobacteriota bacterium]
MSNTQAHEHSKLVPLIVGAVGVVFGDIGTSPLYAVKECFSGAHALELNRLNIFGVLSLMFWAMTIVVSLKYVTFILRADNKGEGGTLSLMALAMHKLASARSRYWVILVGMAGAALFFGDGAITPAMTVLSAVEGMGALGPQFVTYILPISLAIIFVLFFFQRFGTARVGAFFGPIMTLWFISLAVLGVIGILKAPEILSAFSPHHALQFVFHSPTHAFMVLGAVFLVMTGGEALYADIGHFGVKPIRLGWFGFVMPTILINYMGQGALLLTHGDDPAVRASPFFHLAPDSWLLPLVVLATSASIIASQAVITGVFSVVRQAIQLGMLPRMGIVHTSDKAIGQIYIPAVNWVLMLCVCGLIVSFKTSTAIASAYGVAVALTMVLELGLLFIVARRQWLWGPAGIALLVFFMMVDLMFFTSNALKIPHGGWFPLVLAAVLVTIMSTWHRGRSLISDVLKNQGMPMDGFRTLTEGVPRVDGTAIFMTRTPEGIPNTLLHNLEHNKVLHKRVVFLSLVVEDVARVPDTERIEIEAYGSEFYRVIARFGFFEETEVPRVLALCERRGLAFDLADTTFFLSRETLLPSEKPGMAIWREHLFSWMWKSAARAMDFLQLPPNRVVELGTQVEI